MGMHHNFCPSSRQTQKVIRLSRRNMLKAAAASLTTITLAPAIVKDAFSSSGQLDVLMWDTYLPDNFLKAFKAKTGIQVNYTGVGSNEEILRIITDTKGQKFDLVSPTNMRSLQWEPLELLQPFELDRLTTSLDVINPAMLRVGDREWNFSGRGIHWLPHIWGTESIGWRTDRFTPGAEGPSYGNLWEPENIGKIMGRPHSMMAGAGLYLERIGQLKPEALRSAYENPDNMKTVWDIILKFCLSRKQNVSRFWNDSDTQKQAILGGNIIMGQTWDGPMLELKSRGQPIAYQAAIEGAFAWIDGMAIPIGMQNKEQLYAFIDFCYDPAMAGEAINSHSYNSAVLGANKYANEHYAKNFSDAYPGDALSKLFPWPKESVWYAEMRTKYRNKFVASLGLSF